MKEKKENCTNENTLLAIDVSNVFVVKNAKNRAFIEQFEYSSINFTQKDLGTILGFFAVRDEHSSSENIVNYLASEVKKQYFLPNQKSVEDKFESTLHHVNRVLEEVANVGNIEWIGHVDGAICVLTDTTIHMSVTGNAHVLLLRDNLLQNISDGLASKEAAQYPLKTFVDIASGDLCPNDKIIITSQELLDLIPFAELQKNAIRFGQENFIQFVQTALTNECTLASATIIDILPKEAPQPQTTLQPIEIPENIFGADAFDKNLKDEETDNNEKIDVEKLLQNEVPEEWTDKKTGHIYIQGTDEIIEEETTITLFKDRCLDLLDNCKEATIKQKNALTKKITKKTPDTDEEVLKSMEFSTEELNETSMAEDDMHSEEVSHTDNENKEHLEVVTEEFDDIVEDEIINEPTNNTYSTPQKIKVTVFHFCKCAKDIAKNTTTKCIDAAKCIKPTKQTATSSEDEQNDENIPKEKKSILPSISYITQLWQNMDKQTRWTTFGIIAVIIFTPLLFALFSSTPKDTSDKWPEIPEETPNYQPPAEELPQEPLKPISQNTISNPAVLLSDVNTITTTVMNERNIGVTKNTITLFVGDNKEKFNIPTDAGEIVLATPMDDLDLLFFLTTKNRLYTFSPIEKKFVQQKNIPTFDHTKIKYIGTYMTYLYTMSNSAITRYTRAENGFEKGDKWLKETADFTNATTFAIDDNIYTAIDGEILQFAKGEKTSFTQDNSILTATLIYTTEDTKFMWVLDTDENTLYKTKKDTGTKIEEYKHEQFSNATTLSVNEKENIVTITTTNDVLLFNLSS
jgi:hypothetical protein